MKAEQVNLQDYELLEILFCRNNFGQDKKILAKKLINKFGNLASIINSDIALLADVDGIGEDEIMVIKIIKEMMMRISHQKIEQKIIIESWKSLLDYCHIILAHLPNEQLHLLFLDRGYKLITDELYKDGSVDNIVIDPKEITQRALLFSADSLILVHNHPFGDVSPSSADIESTNKIADSLKEFNIKIHDHLIIGSEGYYSFKNNGLLRHY